MSIAAIILAAGRGTRLKSTTHNKVSLMFHDRPIIQYAVDVVNGIATPTVIVVGAFADTVKEALKGYPHIVYAQQQEQLGTGDALKTGVAALPSSSQHVLVGYGDHMMFYTQERIKELVEFHKNQNAAISLLTTHHDNPHLLAWARVIRNEEGNITKLAEQKDASLEELNITEINPGFYCFDYEFLVKSLPLIVPSGVTNEYYLTDLIRIAQEQGDKVAGMPIPFEEVGIGINKPEELQQSQDLFKTVKKS